MGHSDFIRINRQSSIWWANMLLKAFLAEVCERLAIYNEMIMSNKPLSHKINKYTSLHTHIGSSQNEPMCRMIVTSIFVFEVVVTRNRAHGSWFRHYAISRKVASSIPNEIIGYFKWPNPSSCAMALGSTQPLREINTKHFPGGKERPARKADNLTAICELTV
jgi:hypothetical protein